MSLRLGRRTFLVGTALAANGEDEPDDAPHQRRRDERGVAEVGLQQQARDAVNGAEEELLKAVLNLNSLGIQLKGPLEGLIDFPSYRDGELIELCWKLGEERVDHWHRIGEGFAGRKKL